MYFENDRIILTDDQATAYWGDDWIDQCHQNCGTIFFDGHEVYWNVTTDGVSDRCELESADGVNFEEIYG